VKGWKNIFQVNGTQNQAGVAILIPDGVVILRSDKTGFKLNLVRRDKESYFI
jgi:hypothetical protein